MSLAIPTLARRPRPHRRRRSVSPPRPRGDDRRRIILRFEWLEDRTVLSTFTVTSIADSGPGSLRQAILDSNAAQAGASTIAFDIPGAGVQAIQPTSPLPAITNPVLLDGSTQPGFVGAPLITLGGAPGGASDTLIIRSDVTVRALAVSSYRIDATSDERLVAQVHAEGSATRLLLRDSQGQVLMESDGQSPVDPDSLIDIHIPAGSVYLEAESLDGPGGFTLSTTVTPANPPFQPIPTGVAFGMVAGDFNGDGRLDLASAARAAYAVDSRALIGVLLGTGDGTFQPQLTDEVGSGTVSAIAAADFNGDGHLDLAIVVSQDPYFGGPGTVSVLLGRGDGTFRPQLTCEAGPDPTGIAAGDFDGDGHVDMAMTVAGGVSVLLGNGDGTFGPEAIYATGWVPRAPVAADFDGDGHLDLAVNNYGPDPGGDTVSVLLGNGDGTFRPQAAYQVAYSPLYLLAGDFTGDGHLDLAVSDSEGVAILTGTGDGTFQSARRLASESYYFNWMGRIIDGDFNGDGHLDLAYPTGADTRLLLSNADGTLEGTARMASQPFPYMVAGDFNGDGRLDVAAGSFGPTWTMSVLLGYGDASFQQPVVNAVGLGPTSLVTGDFNGDARMDLAVANRDSEDVSVLLGNGDGTFLPQLTLAVGSASSAITSGDFNGDGRLDLAVTNSEGVSVSLGNGDGTLQPGVLYPVGGGPIVAGDFNGDGRLDLAVNISDAIAVLLGNGDGSFQSQVTDRFPTWTFSLVAGDFNGDGRTDLGVDTWVDDASFTTISGAALVLLGNDDGSFRSPLPPAREIKGALVEGDFNGDGRPELALGYPDGTQVLLGDGEGSFRPPVPPAVGVEAGEPLVAGDFNGDGRLDLAGFGRGPVMDDGSGSYSTVSVLLGAGDGTFLPPASYGRLLVAGSLVVGDFNGDGRLDLAIADVGTVDISVFLGDGAGSFLSPLPYEVAAGSPVTGDFNGDGRLDLATIGGSNDVPVLLGDGSGSFVSPGQFATTPHATPLLADFNGDGAEDVLVVNSTGDILYRQGQPGRPASFDPPLIINPGSPSRDLTFVPRTDQGPVLASVDARDDAVSLYAYRDGRFVRAGSLATGRLPAQVIAADLNGTGWDGLVVRNAGDGTLSLFVSNGYGSFETSFNPFLPPVTLDVGLGVSDVQAVDTMGDGRIDLIITNQLTGQVSNLGHGASGVAAAPEPYRAGTGLSALDATSGSPVFTSLEATAGVAAGRLTRGGPTSLVTINPGSKTLGVLAGLGPGRFANPVAIPTKSPAQVIRMADIDHNGISDLAVLSAGVVSIYRGDGRGGFIAPVTYDAGLDPSGLTIADIDHDGRADLLVGNVFGDLLMLLGQGDGSFRPYTKADQAVALAVADLTGDGRPDFIYSDQGLDRVTVQYGSDQTKILGDQSSGLLSPGAVKLADLTGDGIPDLVVANSGSNNVLVYPGLGDGQFGPAANDGHGFFAGSNPAGLAVADLNGDGLADLVVANSGSNDVSVLLSQGSGASWTMTPGPRINTGAGPVAVAVGNIVGDGHPDLAVANQQANDVQVFPGLGGGFFNDQPQAVRTYAVGQAPSGVFLGNFNGSGTGIAALDAGSNTVTVIGPTGVEQTVAAGGLRPTTGFAGDFTGDGFTDLVVGNTADGHLALLTGGAGGLSLSQTITSPAAPEPTGLSFAGVSGGLLSFYVSTAGREAASALAFNLSPGGSAPGVLPGAELAFGPVASAGAVLALATAGAFQQVAQLLSANGTTLSLVAPLFTVTVLPGEFEAGAASEGGVVLLANFLPGTGPGAAGQGLRGNDDGPPSEAADDPAPAEEKAATVITAAPTLPPWEQVAMGLKRAWEQVRAEVLERAGLADGDGARPVATPDRRSKPAPAAVRPPDRPHPRPSAPERAGPDAPDGPSAAASPPGEATDTALAELGGPPVAAPREGPGWWDAVIAAGRGRLAPPIATAAALASAGAAAWAIHAARKGRGGARGPSRPLVSPN